MTTPEILLWSPFPHHPEWLPAFNYTPVWCRIWIQILWPKWMMKRAVGSLICDLQVCTPSMLAPELVLSYGLCPRPGQSCAWAQTWPCRPDLGWCLIIRGFYNDHWYLQQICPGPLVQVLWVWACRLKVLSLPGMLCPLAGSSPGPEEQLTFTAPWHGHTLSKLWSENNSPNLINLPSYIEEGWMCNSYSHNLPSSRCGSFWSSNMNLQGYLLQKPLLELPFCLQLLL